MKFNIGDLCGWTDDMWGNAWPTERYVYLGIISHKRTPGNRLTPLDPSLPDNILVNRDDNQKHMFWDISRENVYYSSSINYWYVISRIEDSLE